MSQFKASVVKALHNKSDCDTGFVSSKGILDTGCQASAHSCKEISSFTYPGDALVILKNKSSNESVFTFFNLVTTYE